MKTMNSFLTVICTLILFFGSTVMASSQSNFHLDLKELDLRPATKSKKKVHALTFDSANSNISVLQADLISADVFDSGNTHGTWNTNLGYEYTMHQYKFSVQWECRDISGRQVRRISRSQVIPRAKAEHYRLSQVLPSFSKIYTLMIDDVRKELEREAGTMNRILEAAKTAPLSAEAAIENIYDELSATLDNSRSIVLLQIAGPDPEVSLKILDDLTKYFVSSTKNFTIVYRHNIDKAIIDRLRQFSEHIDLDSMAEIGKEIDAKVVIFGSWQMINKKRNLVVKAVDVETLRIYSMSSATF